MSVTQSFQCLVKAPELNGASAVRWLLTCATLASSIVRAGEGPAVTVNAKIRGGNVRVLQNRDDVVELAPDLDGGRDWFYWCFEATSTRPGEVVFTFPEKVAGFANGAVGFQGPAVSLDHGRTWRWMGNETAVVRGRSFSYDFSKVGMSVRFAVTIPYLKDDFEAFVRRHADNPNFKTSVLARSPQGRDVPLVQIGRPGPNVKAVLMTARHHACETMASFLLEGLMEAAMSDSPVGETFRDQYVLHVVPFVDVDGVENGDQGKGRAPHDHNRDYGEQSLYPEVQAIMKLGEEKDIRALLDFHCPTLVMDIHQVFYFAGAEDLPQHNKAVVQQFADRIKMELPEGSPYGPLLFMKPADPQRRTHCSGHFGMRPGILMAATLETPFAPAGKRMDPDSVRSYGTAVLRAWNGTAFDDPRTHSER